MVSALVLIHKRDFRNSWFFFFLMKYLIFPLKIYTQSLEHEMDICKAQEAHSLNSGTRFTETSCFHFTEFQAF